MAQKLKIDYMNIDHSYNECLESLKYIKNHYFDIEFQEYNRKIRLLYNDIYATINYVQFLINNTFQKNNKLKEWFKNKKRVFKEKNPIIKDYFGKIRTKGQHFEVINHYETIKTDKGYDQNICSCNLNQRRPSTPALSNIKRILLRTIKGFNNKDIRDIFEDIIKELGLFIQECKREINKYIT